MVSFQAPRKRGKASRVRARKSHLPGLRVENHIEIVLARFGDQFAVSFAVVRVDNKAEDARLTGCKEM